jgi:hypothetical protein
MKKFIIKDWAGNVLDFYGEFDSYDDGWSALYAQFPDEENFDDFYVLEKE